MKRSDFIKDEIEARKAGERQSPLEADMALLLKSHGIPFIAEYPVDRFLVDFALLDGKVAIEVDGDSFHLTKNQQEKDKEKDEYLRSEGWLVYRCSSTKLWKTDRNKILEEITALVAQGSNTCDASQFQAMKAKIGYYDGFEKESAWFQKLKNIDWCHIRQGYYDGYGNQCWQDDECNPNQQDQS